MPEFLEDPSVLTKDRLKSELLANNVTLPAGEQRKDVYVQLYLQHLTVRNRSIGLALPPAANNRAPPDFSSDDEREPTPVLGAAGRGRGGGGGGGGAATGRKATKKTDKPRSEEKDDLDVSELTNEELLCQLVKYGVNPGPIVETTRKLYEKKLLKLREHGLESRSSTPLPMVSSSAENAKQNGNDDSDRYSDNEEELKLEKRDLLVKSTSKATVTTFKQRRVEHNQSYSQAGLSETPWTSGSSKSGALQGLTREPTRGSRRTPRKRVETAEQLRVDGAVISESLPIAETIKASSNETVVVNRVTGNFKHASPILPISEFSDIPRRTPKKPLTRAEVGDITLTEERRIERDILKEMFPFEAATPTGISASCRRPIKGAAGRPLELGDFRMEGTFSSKYVPKYAPIADDKTEKTRKGRSIPMWIKILLFVVVAVFLFLVYQAMETNQGNPFSHFLTDNSPAKAN
ncbi:thymopoietin isoform X2 [Gracilinanus agilis]|uniref:thymopoietin isoform X2 n=1 Tax=Gracilinanus agilis TaxID=191870 RepID=UPI001CFEF353|nr:thymopoietin isoform X2 [Gracilinanus agilis]